MVWVSPTIMLSRAAVTVLPPAKDEVFAHTGIKQIPWFVVNAGHKKSARLNVIRHLLSLIPYEDLTPEPIKLPTLDRRKYIRPSITGPNFVPELCQERDDALTVTK